MEGSEMKKFFGIVFVVVLAFGFTAQADGGRGGGRGGGGRGFHPPVSRGIPFPIPFPVPFFAPTVFVSQSHGYRGRDRDCDFRPAPARVNMWFEHNNQGCYNNGSPVNVVSAPIVGGLLPQDCGYVYQQPPVVCRPAPQVVYVERPVQYVQPIEQPVVYQQQPVYVQQQAPAITVVTMVNASGQVAYVYESDPRIVGVQPKWTLQPGERLNNRYTKTNPEQQRVTYWVVRGNVPADQFTFDLNCQFGTEVKVPLLVNQ
jgi:hypothetical protein